MTKNPREMLNEMMSGMQAVAEITPQQVAAFSRLSNATHAEGRLDVKTKELISVAIAAYNRCEYCIVAHVYKALEVGLTKEEILEAAMVAMAFGGGPTMAYTATLIHQSIEEFSKDFPK